jgi:hypothetical protein
MRNGHPYSYLDIERDPDVQALLDGFHIAASDVPVVICRGQLVLKFGAQMLVAQGTRLACDRKPYVVDVENGARIPARTRFPSFIASSRNRKQSAPRGDRRNDDAP